MPYWPVYRLVTRKWVTLDGCAALTLDDVTEAGLILDAVEDAERKAAPKS